MALQIEAQRRIVRYAGMVLGEIPGNTLKQTQELYAAAYPELLNAEVIVGDLIDNVQEYEFKRAAAGNKGAGGAHAVGDGAAGSATPASGATETRMARLRRLIASDLAAEQCERRLLDTSLRSADAVRCSRAWASAATATAHASAEQQRWYAHRMPSSLLEPLP